MSNVSHTPIESRKSNHDHVGNSHSNPTAHMSVSSLDPSDPEHATYVKRKKDT